MIDRRELLARARERRLTLAMVEKDYVLGWLLFGFVQLPELVFKGGTALAKVYFPEAWRLSEDLDFVSATGRLEGLAARIQSILPVISGKSGIGLVVKSVHENPRYLQLKLQYSGPLGKNWIKVDVTPESPVAGTAAMPLFRSYSDYPGFRIKVETIEEIFAEKLRALVERKKVRDYYDVWRLSGMKTDTRKISALFLKKLEIKGLKWNGYADIFPDGIEETLTGYWENELGRIVYPVPEMKPALETLRERLKWLGKGT